MSALARCVAPLGALAMLLAGAQAAHAQVEAPGIAYTGPSEGPTVASIRAVLLDFATKRGLGLFDLADARLGGTADLSGELDAAIGDYSAFRYTEAISKLDALEKTLEASGGLGLTHRQLADVFIFRAMSKAEAGATDASRDDLIQAATIFPSYQLDEARFRPSLRAGFERARAAVAKADAAIVNVSVPAGCVIHINSERSASNAPIELRPGLHYFRARCGDFEPFAAIVSFESGARQYKPTFVALPDSQARALEAGKTRASLIWINVPRSNPSRVAISLLDTKTGLAKRDWSLLVEDAAGAQKLADVLTSLLETEFSAPQPDPIVIVKPAAVPWYEKNWVWLTVGVVAASAIIIPITVRDSKPTGFGATVEGLP